MLGRELQDQQIGQTSRPVPAEALDGSLHDLRFLEDQALMIEQQVKRASQLRAAALVSDGQYP
jgi:hypothetical protein